MKADIEWAYGEGSRPIIVISLSRRNLLALLAKLDGSPPDSACSIDGGDDARGFRVRAEEDDIHYRHRPSGGMHTETEQAINKRVTGNHEEV